MAIFLLDAGRTSCIFDIRGARAVKAFDVFLSHNNVDEPAVEILAHKLQDAGLEPWLDERCLAAGRVSKLGLATALRACPRAQYSLGEKIKFSILLLQPLKIKQQFPAQKNNC